MYKPNGSSNYCPIPHVYKFEIFIGKMIDDNVKKITKNKMYKKKRKKIII